MKGNWQPTIWAESLLALSKAHLPYVTFAEMAGSQFARRLRGRCGGRLELEARAL
jgi:hypothetical protein